MGIPNLVSAALRAQEGAADLSTQPVHAGDMIIVTMGEKNHRMGKGI